MRTIGHHLPKNSPHGDFETMCDYCGVAYYRSKLIRDAAGFLVCPRDAKGLDVVSLGQIEAANAQRPVVNQYVRDGGNWDHTDDPDPDNPNPPTVPRPL